MPYAFKIYKYSFIRAEGVIPDVLRLYFELGLLIICVNFITFGM